MHFSGHKKDISSGLIYYININESWDKSQPTNYLKAILCNEVNNVESCKKNIVNNTSFYILYQDANINSNQLYIGLLLYTLTIVSGGWINLHESWFYSSLYFIYGLLPILKKYELFPNIQTGSFHKFFLFFPFLLQLSLCFITGKYITLFNFQHCGIEMFLFNILMTLSDAIFFYIYLSKNQNIE